VGWVNEEDNKEGILASCSTMEKGANIGFGAEKSEYSGNTGHVFKTPPFVPSGRE
jgi:hypothetical protein